MSSVTRQAYIRAHRKSFLGALFLSLLLGPIGALYGSPLGGTVLILLSIGTLGWGLIITWPLAIVCAICGVDSHNRRVRARANLE